MPIKIVGGVYIERCLTPNRTNLLGSGGRAAAALVGLSDEVTLESFQPAAFAMDAKIALAAYGVTTIFHDSPAQIGFEYLHPLSSPRIYPVPLPQAGTVDVASDVVLRFGCLEGDFRVNGGRVVYDPQSGAAPAPYSSNGSGAKALALVLNRAEAELLTGEPDPVAAALALKKHDDAQVIVIKMGAAGAMVFENGAQHHVPAYRSEAVDKIGSGDVFSAVFAHFWGEKGMPAADAADLASRYTAGYVEDRCLPLPASPPEKVPLVPPSKPPKVYLGGPFFTTPQRWMIEEARSGLLALGAKVFSPMHDVGFGEASVVARADLAGLDECDVMLALLSEQDPGTLFEVGHARSHGKPVVALMECPRDQDPTMLVGTDCEIVDDLATALYRVVWASS
jgi:hypothetical protein